MDDDILRKKSLIIKFIEGEWNVISLKGKISLIFNIKIQYISRDGWDLYGKWNIKSLKKLAFNTYRSKIEYINRNVFGFFKVDKI